MLENEIFHLMSFKSFMIKLPYSFFLPMKQIKIMKGAKKNTVHQISFDLF